MFARRMEIRNISVKSLCLCDEGGRSLDKFTCIVISDLRSRLTVSELHVC